VISGFGLGQIFALFAAVSWALAVVLLRRSGETLPAFELNLFKNVLGLALLIPTLVLALGIDLPEYSGKDLVIALFSGFLGIAVADTWYLRALNLVGASRTGIVASLFSPFVIMLSVVFLGESLGAWQLLGFGLVMCGVLLVSWRRSKTEVEPVHVRKGILFAGGAVFMMAVGVVMVKEILETRPFLWTLSIRMVGGVAGMLIYVTVRQRWGLIRARFRKPQPWHWIILGSFLGSYLSMMLWLAGYKYIPASEASILNETASAWIVLFAWLMLKESVGLRRLIGLLLTFSGAIVMLLV